MGKAWRRLGIDPQALVPGPVREAVPEVAVPESALPPSAVPEERNSILEWFR